MWPIIPLIIPAIWSLGILLTILQLPSIALML
jgi:hypothetical protein